MWMKRLTAYVVVTISCAATMISFTPNASAKPALRKVPFSILIPNRSSGVLTTSSVSFPYILSRKGIKPLVEGEQGPPVTLFSAKRNDCSSVHVDFVFGETHIGGGTYPYLKATSGTISVVQQSRAGVKSTTSFEFPGSVVTNLVPGQTWGITAAATKPAGNPIGSFEVFVNGYAMCQSTGRL